MASDGSPADIVFRHAGDADVAGQHAAFVAAEGELLARHGFAWPAPPFEAVAPSYRHLMRHDGERCYVAEANGHVAGYVATFVRGDTAFLAALFIDPAFQGRGIGRRLLELSMAGAPDRRMTITDAIQPISNALYARFGMLPATPILAFSGTAQAVPEPGLAATAAEPSALATIDRAGYGFDRAVDHAFWAARAGPTLWLRDGAAAAYSYRWPTGRIGPLAGIDEAAAAAALTAELASRPNTVIQVPGTSRSLVRVAFDAGLRLQAPAGLLLLSDSVPAPRALAISSYGLL